MNRPSIHWLPPRPARGLLGFLALLSLAGCGSRDQATEEQDIREAVYRYQFGQDLQLGDEGPYLAIVVDGQDKDPDPAFMQRFAEDRPIVHRASECEYFPGRGLRNKQTGRRGIILHTGEITWVSGRRVQVAGGCNLGAQAAQDTYHLTKTLGGWHVTRRVRQASF